MSITHQAAKYIAEFLKFINELGTEESVTDFGASALDPATCLSIKKAVKKQLTREDVTIEIVNGRFRVYIKPVVTL